MISVQTPRDQSATFEPEIICKR
nr:hypothetical protein [Pedobacter segetis]